MFSELNAMLCKFVTHIEKLHDLHMRSKLLNEGEPWLLQ